MAIHVDHIRDVSFKNYFLDVDHKDTQSEIVQNLLRQFPTYAEVSPKRLHSGWYLKDYELNEKELSSLRL